jgi:hypothetical protein
MGFRRHATLLWTMLALCCWFPLCAAGAAAPALKLTATNVSMGDHDTGTSKFTLTSLNGFTGQVVVTCSGGSIPLPALDEVEPICSSKSQVLTVPANGSVSGSVEIGPPWVSSGSLKENLPAFPGRKPLGMPIAAGGLAAACLLGLRLRRGWRHMLGMMALFAAGLAGLGSMTGCIGHGGLAMTPGSYDFSVYGNSLTGGTHASADIKVTIHI